MKIAKIVTALFCTITIACYVHAQGSLTPPGAPAETMKTLEQVEPRTDVATLSGDDDSEIIITDSGSYYLSSNLNVTKVNGIDISATDVTLDLNGFTIARTSGTGGAGIRALSIGSSIRDGRVTGFNDGVNGSGAESLLFENLTASECLASGIFAGASSRIINCRAINNNGHGIIALQSSSVSGCTVYNNSGTYGIFVHNGSIVAECSVYDSTGTYGIYGGDSSIIRDCAVYLNDVWCGIYVGSGRVIDCSVYDNTGTDSASYGIYSLNNSLISGSLAYGNSNTNSPGTSTRGCGIYAGSSSTVKNCNVTSNDGDGIRVVAGCLVFGNNSESNGSGGDGAGIHATLSDNRIENNNVTGQDRGIDVESSGNFIVRNSATGNSADYSIAGTQTIGPIITATGTITNTSPWANFSY
jgi:parallel beta-helix repeat protein